MNMNRVAFLGLLLTPISAQAADFEYLRGGFAPPPPQTTIVERRVAYPSAGVVLERRIVAPAPRPTRVIEHRTVETPVGVTRTTRIYESHAHGIGGYAPRPPRNIPFVSDPYRVRSAPRIYADPILAGPRPLAPSGLQDDFEEAEYE